MAEGIDGEHIKRLPELFERIMNNRRSSGMFGNSFDLSGDEPEACIAPGTHFISGLVNYYSLTGDMRALNAAEDCADRFLCRFDDFCDKYANPNGFNYMECWIVEGLAELYRETKNERYLEAVRRIAFECLGLLEGSHSHGYMTTLRGILKAAAIRETISLQSL